MWKEMHASQFDDLQTVDYVYQTWIQMKNLPNWGKHSNHCPNAVKEALRNSCCSSATIQPMLDVIQSL